MKTKAAAWPHCILAWKRWTANRAGSPAAVIVEPIVSAGGVIELPVEYLQGLRKELDKRGALLIYDEAQTGLGKLGKMFGYQVSGVMPDVLTVSKHLGGGLAVSAAIATDDVVERATRHGFSTGHSHSSDPLACAAGVASICEIVENDLPKRALEIGEHWQSNVRALEQRYDIIGDVRGRGLMQGIRACPRSVQQGACNRDSGRGLSLFPEARSDVFRSRQIQERSAICPTFHYHWGATRSGKQHFRKCRAARSEIAAVASMGTSEGHGTGGHIAPVDGFAPRQSHCSKV